MSVTYCEDNRGHPPPSMFILPLASSKPSQEPVCTDNKGSLAVEDTREPLNGTKKIGGVIGFYDQNLASN